MATETDDQKRRRLEAKYKKEYKEEYQDKKASFWQTLTTLRGVTDAITAEDIDDDLAQGLADSTLDDVITIFRTVHAKLGQRGPRRLYEMWELFENIVDNIHEVSISFRYWRSFWEQNHEWVVLHPFNQPSQTSYERYYIDLKNFIELDSTITFMSSRLAIKRLDYAATLNVAQGGHRRDETGPPQVNRE